MSIFSAIGNWFKSLGNLVKKLWNIAEPFLLEVLSQEAQKFWTTSQDLLVAAAQYVSTQGLPTSDAARKAFGDYMLSKVKDEWSTLKEWEQNLLREMALSIAKKITG